MTQKNLKVFLAIAALSLLSGDVMAPRKWGCSRRCTRTTVVDDSDSDSESEDETPTGEAAAGSSGTPTPIANPVAPTAAEKKLAAAWAIERNAHNEHMKAYGLFEAYDRAMDNVVHYGGMRPEAYFPPPNNHKLGAYYPLRALRTAYRLDNPILNAHLETCEELDTAYGEVERTGTLKYTAWTHVKSLLSR